MQPWTPTLSDLWQRIERHEFETAVTLNFTARLARDKNWSMQQARAAVLEYRRFCFLAVASGLQATPSEEVDEVWHLHLTYSRDYWDIWCRDVLRRRLHHDPTQGGPVQQARFRDQYAATLAAYEAWFGPPPLEFWPGTRQRFRGNTRFRCLDTDRYFMVPKPFVAWRSFRAWMGP
jgi:hypothetical protein